MIPSLKVDIETEVRIAGLLLDPHEAGQLDLLERQRVRLLPLALRTARAGSSLILRMQPALNIEPSSAILRRRAVQGSGPGRTFPCSLRPPLGDVPEHRVPGTLTGFPPRTGAACSSLFLPDDLAPEKKSEIFQDPDDIGRQ